MDVVVSLYSIADVKRPASWKRVRRKLFTSNGRVKSWSSFAVRGIGACVTWLRLTCLTVWSSRFLSIVFPFNSETSIV